jgi:beta-1,4-mannosyl-glycoprotein beta-1,4-N-acetylglucosaminyltransferase
MIIDTFIFYNELDILELRLTVLDPYVDRFVLVESELNHVGLPKELFFERNKQRYAQWLHKITHIVIRAEDMPMDTNALGREKFQRDYIVHGLADVPDDVTVMLSDVDEIPDLARIQLKTLPVVIHMWMFEYSFKYLHIGEPWFGTVITTAADMKTRRPTFFRDNRWSFNRFTYAGWHLTSFGDAKHVLNKINTYSHHADVGIFAERTMDTFERIIRDGIHHDGKTKLIPWTPNVPLPAPVDVLSRIFGDIKLVNFS